MALPSPRGCWPLARSSKGAESISKVYNSPWVWTKMTAPSGISFVKADKLYLGWVRGCTVLWKEDWNIQGGQRSLAKVLRFLRCLPSMGRHSRNLRCRTAWHFSGRQCGVWDPSEKRQPCWQRESEALYSSGAVWSCQTSTLAAGLPNVCMWKKGSKRQMYPRFF